MTSSFELSDVQPEVKGTFEMRWTCPRCDHRQIIYISTFRLWAGIDIQCRNSQVCGQGNINLFLTLEGVGSYKDTSDIPLIEVGGQPNYRQGKLADGGEDAQSKDS